MKLFAGFLTFCLAVFFGTLLALRLFPTELCLVRIDVGQCESEPEAANEFEVATLLQRIHDGLRRVQKANGALKEPHLLFVDDLELEIQFVAKRTAGGSFELVVVPFDGQAGTEKSEVQKMKLTFSTVLDDKTQKYIKEACRKGSEFANDHRVVTFCPSAEGAPSETPDKVTINAEGLGIDVGSFATDYKLPKEVQQALDTACDGKDCGEVTRFSVDPVTKNVRDLVIAPAPGANAPGIEQFGTKEWSGKALYGGRILLQPSAID